MSTALTAFTTTHRVIVRVHDNTTVVRASAEPTATTGLTRRFQCVIAIADAANGSLAGTEDTAGLTRGEFDNAIAALAGC